MSNFEKAIFDAVNETFLKLGYSETAVTLRYPPETLKTLFGDRSMTDGSLDERLSTLARGDGNEVDGIFSGLKSTKHDGTYVLTFPAAFAAYVHENVAPDPFAVDLIAVCQTFFAGADDVHAVFRKYSDNVKIVSPNDGGEALGHEFDEAISFADGRDPYVYLFDYDDERVSYHRLLHEDFAALFPGENG